MSARHIQKTVQKKPGPPRWTHWLMLLSGCLSMGGLVFARYLDERQFIYGLLIVGAGVGLMACAVAARVLGPKLWRPGTLGLFVAVAGVGAALGRWLLLRSLSTAASGPPTLVMSREIMIGVPISLALCALFLGAYAIYRTFSLPPGGLRARAAQIDLAGGIAALTASLYTLGPLMSSFGVPLNHWTFLGLVALGITAFLAVTVYEKLF